MAAGARSRLLREVFASVPGSPQGAKLTIVSRRCKSTTPIHIAIAGCGVSGSILASQLAKKSAIRVTVLERFSRGGLPPGLNLLLNHNGMAALQSLDPQLAIKIRGIGHPTVSWSASTLTGHTLYSLGDVTVPARDGAFPGEPLADEYGLRGRWRDITATCQLAAMSSRATILWNTQIDSVKYNDVGAGIAGHAPLTLTLRRAAKHLRKTTLRSTGGSEAVAYTNHDDIPGSLAGHESQEAEEVAWCDAKVEQLDVDLLIGCDGRYSAVRTATIPGPESPCFGPPFVSDFRLVVPCSTEEAEAFFSDSKAFDLRRLYNTPHLQNLALIPTADLTRPENAGFADHCMQGLARVGVMTITPNRLDSWGKHMGPKAAVESSNLFVGFFGNFRTPPGANEPIPPVAKTAKGLQALFTPPGGESALDELGRFVLRSLTEHASQLHWTRMQSTAQRVLPGVGDSSCANDNHFQPSAVANFGGRVLLLGDSAGAMYPALGQGANQAVEDASVAAHVLGTASEGAIGDAQDVAARLAGAVDAIWRLRQPRREFVAALSAQHAEHISNGGEAALVAEAADWTGHVGGRYDGFQGHQQGAWRNELRSLWSGWQRPSDCRTAFGLNYMKHRKNNFAQTKWHAPVNSARIPAQVKQQQRASFSTFTASTVAPAAKLLTAKTATRHNFRTFGDLVMTSVDGIAWSSEADAMLEGFDGSCGAPRLYLMELLGPRPLSFDRITHHARVTQCLGAASETEDFYLAVHEPTLTADGGAAPPNPARVQVFRIAPHNFVKLHKGTWHAGPLWGEASKRVFYNLELHDTNETDHTTFVFSETFAFEKCA